MFKIFGRIPRRWKHYPEEDYDSPDGSQTARHFASEQPKENVSFDICRQASSLSEQELQRILQEQRRKSRRSSLHLFSTSSSRATSIASSHVSSAAVAAALEDTTSDSFRVLLSFASAMHSDLRPETISIAFARILQLAQNTRTGADFLFFCQLTRRLLTQTTIRVCFGLIFLSNNDFQRRVIAIMEDSAMEFNSHPNECYNNSNLSSYERAGDTFPIYLVPHHWVVLSILVLLGRLMAEGNVDFATSFATSPLFSKALAHVVIEGMAFHAVTYFIRRRSSSRNSPALRPSSPDVLDFQSDSQRLVSIALTVTQRPDNNHIDRLSTSRYSVISTPDPVTLAPDVSDLAFPPADSEESDLPYTEPPSYDLRETLVLSARSHENSRPSHDSSRLFRNTKTSHNINSVRLSNSNSEFDTSDLPQCLSQALLSPVVHHGAPQPRFAVSFSVDNDRYVCNRRKTENNDKSESYSKFENFEPFEPPDGVLLNDCPNSPYFPYDDPDRSDGIQETGVRTSMSRNSSHDEVISPRPTVSISPEIMQEEREEDGKIPVKFDCFSIQRARLEAMKLLPKSMERFMFGSIFVDIAAIPGIERKFLSIFEYLTEADEAEHLAIRSGIPIVDAILSCDALYQMVSSATATLVAMLHLLERMVQIVSPDQNQASSTPRAKSGRSVLSSASSPSSATSSTSPTVTRRSILPKFAKNLWSQLFKSSQRRDQTEDTETPSINTERSCAGVSDAVLDELKNISITFLLRLAGGCKYHHFHVTDAHTRPMHFGISVESLVSGSWTGRPTRGMLSTCNYPTTGALRAAQNSVYKILEFLGSHRGGPWEIAADMCPEMDAILVIENVSLVSKNDSPRVVKSTRVLTKFAEYSHCCFCGKNFGSVYASYKPLKRPPVVICIGCQFVRYCCNSCQKQDWSMHQGFCQMIQSHFTARI